MQTNKRQAYWKNKNSQKVVVISILLINALVIRYLWLKNGIRQWSILEGVAFSVM